jgi:hypothetical protein
MLRYIKAINRRSSGRRRKKVQEKVDDGCLAGAIGSKQANDLAGFDFQTQVIQGPKAAKVFRQMRSFQHYFLPPFI